MSAIQKFPTQWGSKIFNKDNLLSIIPELSTPQEAYEFAFYHNYRLLDYEQLIATDTKYSYLYARDIMHSKFELGENSISKDGRTSFLYAIEVLHSRFKLGEKEIAKSSYSLIYISSIFHDCAPIDFLEICNNEILKYLLRKEYTKNKEEVIKVLFKKKILNNE